MHGRTASVAFDANDPNRTAVGYPCGAFRPCIWSLKGSTYTILCCCQELRFRCPVANLSSNPWRPVSAPRHPERRFSYQKL